MRLILEYEFPLLFNFSALLPNLRGVIQSTAELRTFGLWALRFHEQTLPIANSREHFCPFLLKNTNSYRDKGTHVKILNNRILENSEVSMSKFSFVNCWRNPWAFYAIRLQNKISFSCCDEMGVIQLFLPNCPYLKVISFSSTVYGFVDFLRTTLSNQLTVLVERVKLINSPVNRPRSSD